MKTTDEIRIEADKWFDLPATDEELYFLRLYPEHREGISHGFIGGYRTAEAEYSEAIRELKEALQLIDCMDVNPKTTDKTPMQIYMAMAGVARKVLTKYKEANHG